MSNEQNMRELIGWRVCQKCATRLTLPCSVSGTESFAPFYSLDSPFDTTLVFESRFEGRSTDAENGVVRSNFFDCLSCRIICYDLTLLVVRKRPRFENYNSFKYETSLVCLRI
jgi:hypothetical protein